MASAFTVMSPTSIRMGSVVAGFSRHAVEFPDEAESTAEVRGISSQELREVSEARRRRLEEEREQKSRFVTGDALHQLRREVLGLSEELQLARRDDDHQKVTELEYAIWHAQQVDAEYVYHVSVQRARAAEASGLAEEAYEHRREAKRARSALPQFDLGGLWVGKYGDHGFEMINVTYVGDVLVAYKITGDQNVPKGEITFTVDLSMSAAESMLEPIELNDEASEQWGSRFLQRFTGRGQVAQTGFVSPHWMDGQMILVNQYFSFAWLPIGHQVFFGRPSPELTLKLLRDNRKKNNSVDNDRRFLERCLEETELLEEDMETECGLYSSSNQGDYYSIEGCWE